MLLPPFRGGAWPMQDPSERPRSLLRREIERMGEDRRYGTSTSGLSSTSSGGFGRGEDDQASAFSAFAESKGFIPQQKTEEETEKIIT